MFKRGDRQRREDRARTAPITGNVGRNLGDQPYIMDVVFQDHFLAGALPIGFGFTSTDFFIVEQTPLTTLTGFRITTGTTAGTTSRSTLSTTFGVFNGPMAGFNRDSAFRCRVRYSAVNANARIFTGFGAADDVATSIDGIFFGIDGSVSTGYFVCVTRGSGAATNHVLDGTGDRAKIAVDTSWHDVSIVCDSTSGVVRYYVDGRLATTISTDIPTGPVGPHWSVQNGATAAERYIDVDVLVLTEAAP